MGADPYNLFTYARQVVDHKTVMQRIGHSPALHSTRSAFSSWGSFGSKLGNLVGGAARAAMSLAPWPAAPALAASLEKHAEALYRRHLHRKHVIRVHVDPEDKVKFQLKDLSVEEMDRYRWKLHQSLDDIKTASNSYNAKLAKATQEHARCAEYVELAKAVEQAERRKDRLYAICYTIKHVIEDTLFWIDRCNVRQAEGQIRTHLKQDIEEYNRLTDEQKRFYIEAYHAHCTGWCWARDVNEPPGATPRLDKCAGVLNWLAEGSWETVEHIGIEQVGEYRDKVA